MPVEASTQYLGERALIVSRTLLMSSLANPAEIQPYCSPGLRALEWRSVAALALVGVADAAFHCRFRHSLALA